MIELRTGKPGSGKTATLIEDLLAEQKRSGRQVFYANIPECTAPGWLEFPDPRKWRDLPTGAILVVDEAQKFFPQRKKDEPDPYIKELSEHRHYGVDLYLITQDAMLVDIWVRRLAGRHVHVVRTGMGGLLSVTSWNNVVADPTDPQVVKEYGTQVTRRLPTKVFGLYKSADLHTPQVRPPYLKLMKYGGAVMLMVALAAFAYDRISSSTDKPNTEVVAMTNAAASLSQSAAELRSAVADLRRAFQPEVKGLPWSAPFYRAMVQPQEMPIVMGCAVVTYNHRTECRCEDQQGAKIPMAYRQCLEFAKELPYDWSGTRPRLLEAQRAALSTRQSATAGAVSTAGGGGDERAAPPAAALASKGG